MYRLKKEKLNSEHVCFTTTNIKKGLAAGAGRGVTKE